MARAAPYAVDKPAKGSPLALCKAIRPSGFGSPATRSPQKAPLEDLSVCYPRLRQVAFGMYMPRFNADVQRPTPKEEAPMNTTATTAVVTPFTQNNNKQQKQTAKEVIAANAASRILLRFKV